ncbi:hypothetical protein RDI58_001063 [Solanum bulbocastanum]|uniref:Uncharacterized protein n=1 Tax=Solanum bulbocastanum TaxID=147425 RepID=A0AAN8YPR2_SOLBU
MIAGLASLAEVIAARFNELLAGAVVVARPCWPEQLLLLVVFKREEEERRRGERRRCCFAGIGVVVVYRTRWWSSPDVAASLPLLLAGTAACSSCWSAIAVG